MLIKETIKKQLNFAIDLHGYRTNEVPGLLNDLVDKIIDYNEKKDQFGFSSLNKIK